MTSNKSSGTDSIAAKSNPMSKASTVSEMIGYVVGICTVLWDILLRSIILGLCTLIIATRKSTGDAVPAVVIALEITSLLGAIFSFRLDNPSTPNQLFRCPHRQGYVQVFLLIAYIVCAMLWKVNNDPINETIFEGIWNTRLVLVKCTMMQILVQFTTCHGMLSSWLTEKAASSRTEQAVTNKKSDVCGPGSEDSTI
ncbi:hypothetical protein BZA77DRAFT_298694 [Pyronema omphalodes]|nr:hypothetical protein BZA77DRAFT_298694 [Pyronema omphalodes]